MKTALGTCESAPSSSPQFFFITLWIAGLPIVVWLAWMSFMGPHPVAGSDFGIFWVAGHLGSRAYSAEAIRSEMARLLFDPIVLRPFPYPPFMLFVWSALSRLPIIPAYILWNFATALLFIWTARPFIPKGLPPILFTPAATLCILFGQVGLLYGALWFLAFRGSGIALALLTFKPLLGCIAAVGKLPRQLVVASLTFILFAVLAECSFPGAWVGFFAVLAHQVIYLKGAMIVHYTQMTTPALGYGIAGWLFYAAGALYFLYRNFNVWTAASAVFLISPYGFHYDMTVASLGFAVLLRLHWHALLRWQRTVGVLGFLTPELVIFGTWWIPPIILLGLCVQTQFLRVPPQSSIRLNRADSAGQSESFC